ncbi:MAG: hypothetical protein HDR83_05340 [Bacteroides sp.]|nr:hypothetical protein [Barnesiella sp.]MBD5368665.1 hypothetical protein [Bacteroides sp.]
MKKSLCLLIASAMSAVSFAQGDAFEWLTFSLTDGSEVAVAAENLSLNFSDGVLRLSSASVDTSFDVANLRSMRFTSDASGIADVEALPAARAEYFTVAGVSAGVFDSVDDARAALTSGMYIARSESRSWKVMF